MQPIHKDYTPRENSCPTQIAQYLKGGFLDLSDIAAIRTPKSFSGNSHVQCTGGIHAMPR